jgi:hypothetical protein
VQARRTPLWKVNFKPRLGRGSFPATQNSMDTSHANVSTAGRAHDGLDAAAREQQVGTLRATIPLGLRILSLVLRALFIGALVALTVRVSSPQSESFASVHETPGDLIRLALGFAVCLWILIHLFMPPRTPEGYTTWIYLGLVVAPLAWAIVIMIW